MKSSSKIRISRQQALKRQPWFRAPIESDFKWFWAAYKKGAFDEVFRKLADDIGEDVEDQNHVELTFLLKAIFDTQDFIVIVINAQRGETPIGLMELRDRITYIEPHALWFPWATPRNILEGTLGFLTEMRTRTNLLIFATKSTREFWKRMKDFGVLARVGTIPNHFPDGAEAQLWRSD